MSGMSCFIKTTKIRATWFGSVAASYETITHDRQRVTKIYTNGIRVIKEILKWKIWHEKNGTLSEIFSSYTF
jgi:hypothetical protein